MIINKMKETQKCWPITLPKLNIRQPLSRAIRLSFDYIQSIQQVAYWAVDQELVYRKKKIGMDKALFLSADAVPVD